MQLRRRQNKQQVLRRLFDDLEQRIERRDRQHVHLVNDVHAHFDLAGRIDCVVAQRAHRVHAVIRCRVDLLHVHAAAVVNGAAGRAAVAGVAVVRMLAVDGLGQNFRARGLARAARAGKEIGVAELAGDKLRTQRLGHAALADHVGKRLRPVFSVQRLIHAHSPLHFVFYYTRNRVQRKAAFQKSIKTGAWQDCTPFFECTLHPLPTQPARKRLPRGTQGGLLSAAWFPT